MSMDPSEARKAWASRPWQPLAPSEDNGETTRAWSKMKVPYLSHANTLQTVDVHVPGPGPPTMDSPHASSLWLIYIHGGAWRDPTVTSAAILPALHLLLSSTKYASILPSIAGIASLNYTLSPSPNYPPGTFPGDADGSREATHPRHIADVLAAITYLHAVVPMEQYALIGHSCGATLAFQTIMPQIWDSSFSPTKFPRPTAIGGLAGLYDLPALIHDPGPRHEKYREIYRTFVIGAFGEEEEDWGKVSPTRGVDTRGCVWGQGVLVLVGDSEGDTLVPMGQGEGLVRRLGGGVAGEDGGGGTAREEDRDSEEEEKERLVEYKHIPLRGDHDEIWKTGEELARFFEVMVVEVVKRIQERANQ